jgi:predicted RNA binding protein YcfA (HicA-like mRNA interferase family)
LAIKDNFVTFIIINVRELLNIIEKDGWYIVRIKGSHRQLKHEHKKGTVTIAGKKSDDVPPGTLKSVFKQAGIEK